MTKILYTDKIVIPKKWKEDSVYNILYKEGDKFVDIHCSYQIRRYRIIGIRLK